MGPCWRRWQGSRSSEGGLGLGLLGLGLLGLGSLLGGGAGVGLIRQ